MRAIRFMCYAQYFLVGILNVVIPTIMPVLISDFGLDLASASMIFPAKSIGALFVGLLSGLWLDATGYRLLSVLGGCLSGLGLFLVAGSGTWALFLLGFMIVGVAQAVLSTAINTLTADVAAESRAKGLNFLHGTYSIGALVGPLWLALISNWRLSVTIIAVIWCGFGVWAALQAYPQRQRQSLSKAWVNLGIVKDPAMVLCLLVAFCYNGIAGSMLGWVNTYMQQTGRILVTLSLGAVSIFYLGLSTGRFTCGLLSSRFEPSRIIQVCALGGLLGYIMVLYGPSPVFMVLGLLVSGLSLAGLYPTALAYMNGIESLPKGTATALMQVAMSLGAMVPPTWTGIIASTFGLRVGIAVNLLLFIPLFVVAKAWMPKEQAVAV